MTIQGLLAYYYDMVVPQGTAVELNRCMFNQIGDNPRRSNGFGHFPRGTPTAEAVQSGQANWTDGDCRDGRTNCDDVQCQTHPIEDIYLLHYTYCKSPMGCRDAGYNMTKSLVKCQQMHREWFSIRKELDDEKRKEKSIDDSSQTMSPADLQYFPDIYQGFCRGEGDYIPI